MGASVGHCGALHDAHSHREGRRGQHVRHRHRHRHERRQGCERQRRGASEGRRRSRPTCSGEQLRAERGVTRSAAPMRYPYLK